LLFPLPELSLVCFFFFCCFSIVKVLLPHPPFTGGKIQLYAFPHSCQPLKVDFRYNRYYECLRNLLIKFSKCIQIVAPFFGRN
jgi:hypothetical protein